MTANQTAPANDLFASFIAAGAQIMRVIGKVFLALMIIMAAGVVAIATAVAGLFLAAAAIVMRYTGAGRRSRRAREGDSITLEARRTARGWTVE